MLSTDDVVVPEALLQKVLAWMQDVVDCWPMDYYPLNDDHKLRDVPLVNELRAALHLDPWQPEMD